MAKEAKKGSESFQDALQKLSSYIELARAFVPVQIYTQRLQPSEALRAGTIFPELRGTPPIGRT